MFMSEEYFTLKMEAAFFFEILFAENEDGTFFWNVYASPLN